MPICITLAPLHKPTPWSIVQSQALSQHTPKRFLAFVYSSRFAGATPLVVPVVFARGVKRLWHSAEYEKSAPHKHRNRLKSLMSIFRAEGLNQRSLEHFAVEFLLLRRELLAF